MIYLVPIVIGCLSVLTVQWHACPIHVFFSLFLFLFQVARACFEIIRDHRLEEIDAGQTACAPMGGQGPGPKTKLAFLGYPKSGTSVSARPSDTPLHR